MPDLTPAIDLERFPTFDACPAAVRRRAFGVDYVLVRLPDGDELYVTRFGYPRLRWIDPRRWYHDRRLTRTGDRLAGGSGTVYRVAVRDGETTRVELVVKFSRMAQDFRLTVSNRFLGKLGDRTIDARRFNGPFQEFGALMDLRRAPARPTSPRIRTKLPYAIHVPARRHALWQLGRTDASFAPYRLAQERDQEGVDPPRRVELEIDRKYILLFGWVDGEDARALCDQGLLSEQETQELTLRVVDELARKGFEMLDVKPRHFILRRRRGTGEILRRHGELVYALIDFELLFRTGGGSSGGSSEGTGEGAGGAARTGR